MERVLVDGLDRDHAYISYKCTILQATLFLFDRCELIIGLFEDKSRAYYWLERRNVFMNIFPFISSR